MKTNDNNGQQVDRWSLTEEEHILYISKEFVKNISHITKTQSGNSQELVKSSPCQETKTSNIKTFLGRADATDRICAMFATVQMSILVAPLVWGNDGSVNGLLYSNPAALPVYIDTDNRVSQSQDGG